LPYEVLEETRWHRFASNSANAPSDHVLLNVEPIPKCWFTSSGNNAGLPHQGNMAIGAGVATSGSTAKLLIETPDGKIARLVMLPQNINSRGKLTITAGTALSKWRYTRQMNRVGK
jgi:hypothetical protein